MKRPDDAIEELVAWQNSGDPAFEDAVKRTMAYVRYLERELGAAKDYLEGLGDARCSVCGQWGHVPDNVRNDGLCWDCHADGKIAAEDDRITQERYDNKGRS